MGKIIDLVNKRFGRLIVVSQAASDKNNNKRWRCFCSCGSEIVTYGNSLRSEHSQSCGCYRKELAAETNYVHGDSCTPNSPYSTWQNMRNRCNNPNDDHYQYYGGRGISVCKEWEDYTAFRKFARENCWQKGYSIHRIYQDGNYEPGNCYFLPISQHSKYHKSVQDEQRKVEKHNLFIENLAELMNNSMHEIVDKAIGKAIARGEFVDVD